MKFKSFNRLSNRQTNGLILAIIIIISLILRVYHFTYPIADANSLEQSKTLLVARTILRGGSIIGRYQESTLEQKLPKESPLLYNPSRLLLFETKTALYTKIFPMLTLETAGRLINSFAICIIIACIFFLSLRHQTRLSAIASALFIACSPYVLLQSHQITPHLASLAMIVCGIIFLYLSVLSKKQQTKSALYYGASLGLTIFSITSQPMMVVFLLPIVYLFYQRYGLEMFRSVYVYAYIILSVIPSIYLNYLTQTLPQLISLPIWANQVDSVKAPAEIIFFQKVFILTMLQQRLINAILGGIGVAFVCIGFFKKNNKTTIFHWFGLSGLLSVLLFPHEHMAFMSVQMLLIPALALYFGSGIGLLFGNRREFSVNFVAFILMCVFVTTAVFLSWQEIKPYFVVDTTRVQVAKIIATLTSPTEQIATDTKGDPILLYLANRDGVPTTDNGDSDLKQAGIRYLETGNSNYATTLREQYKPIFTSKDAFIFDLIQ